MPFACSQLYLCAETCFVFPSRVMRNCPYPFGAVAVHSQQSENFGLCPLLFTFSQNLSSSAIGFRPTIFILYLARDSFAIAIYFSSRSYPIYRLPSLWAVVVVVPIPLNGSRTMSSGCVVRSRQFSTSCAGNGAGWIVWRCGEMSHISPRYSGSMFPRNVFGLSLDSQ